MSMLVIDIAAITGLARQVTETLVRTNADTAALAEDGDGPQSVQQALYGFLAIAGELDRGGTRLSPLELVDLADHGLDLLDRLSALATRLRSREQGGSLLRLYPTLAVWLARHGARIRNLAGITSGFAAVADGLHEPGELTELCLLMEEVLDASAASVQADLEKSDPGRPWRILNLNEGIVATRSHDPRLMDSIFDKLTLRLPEDMPGFFAEGMLQMDTLNYPAPVRAVMNRYAEKWSNKVLH